MWNVNCIEHSMIDSRGGVYTSKHYKDIVGCAVLEGGARSDQNELNTQSFTVRGPQPDVYQAYEMALFYFVNVLFMAEKKFSNNVLFLLNLGCVQRIGLQLVRV